MMHSFANYCVFVDGKSAADLVIFMELYSQPGALNGLNEVETEELVSFVDRLIALLDDTVQPNEHFQYTICDTLRICFRVKLPLAFVQISLLFNNLLKLCENECHNFNNNTPTSNENIPLIALKCLVNILFNDTDRMNIFCGHNAVNGVQRLSLLLQHVTMKCEENKTNEITNMLLPVWQYVVKIFYMTVSQRCVPIVWLQIVVLFSLLVFCTQFTNIH